MSIDGSFFGGDDGGFGGGNYGMQPFPDPFSDLSMYSLPHTIQNALRWSEFVFYASPVFAAAQERLASYFLTDLSVVGEKLSKDQKEEIREYLHDELGIMEVLKQANLDELCYGNSFVSVLIPFRRYLVCPRCFLDFPLRVVAEHPEFKYRWNAFQFEARCPRCEFDGAWNHVDRRCGPETKPIIKHWSPHFIELIFNELTGKTSYIWRIQEDYKRQIVTGKLDMLEDCPWEVVQAIKANSFLRFADDVVFHSKEMTISGIRNRGWGISRTIRCFRQVFYVQMLHRYNEAIASDYCIPFRVLTPGGRPGSSDASGDPLLSMSLGSFGSRIEGMLRNHRRDPASWNWLPFPIQYQALGGEATQLAPKDLLDQGVQTLLNSINLPLEMFNLSLTTNNAPVNLRFFEQIWSHMPSGTNRLLNWILGKLISHMGWEQATAALTPTTLADDAERQLSKLQLMSSGVVSKTTGLRVVGLNAEDEMQQQLEEQRQQAEAQQKMQEEMQEAGLQSQIGTPPIMQMAQGQQGAPGQAPAQGDPSQQQPGAAQSFAAATPTGPNTPTTPQDVMSSAQTIASQLLALPESQKDSQLIALKKQNPLLHSAVKAMITDMRQQAQTQGGAQILQQQKQALWVPTAKEGALAVYRRMIERRRPA